MDNASSIDKDLSDDEWTIEYTIDKLYLCLAGIRRIVTDCKKDDDDDNRSIHFRKYYHQARMLMKWIPIAKPPPEFVIDISDLPPRLAKELQEKITDNRTRRYVATQAAGRIFENLDFEYYHLSIARNLCVRFEK